MDNRVELDVGAIYATSVIVLEFSFIETQLSNASVVVASVKRCVKKRKRKRSNMHACPKCGGVLSEHYKKVKFVHPFGRSENTLRVKTKKTKAYYCKQCKQYFVISWALVPAELAD